MIQRFLHHFSKPKSISSRINLKYLGIKNIIDINYNLSYPELIDREVSNCEGTLLNTKYGDVFSIDTGIFTGRSPKDKWIVKTPNSISEKNIWWGDVNQPIHSNIFDQLYEKTIDKTKTFVVIKILISFLFYIQSTISLLCKIFNDN